MLHCLPAMCCGLPPVNVIASHDCIAWDGTSHLVGKARHPGTLEQSAQDRAPEQKVTVLVICDPKNSRQPHPMSRINIAHLAIFSAGRPRHSGQAQPSSGDQQSGLLPLSDSPHRRPTDSKRRQIVGRAFEVDARGQAPAERGQVAAPEDRPWQGWRGQAPVRGTGLGVRCRQWQQGPAMCYRETADAGDRRPPSEDRWRRRRTGHGRAGEDRLWPGGKQYRGLWCERLVAARAPVVPIGRKITILLDSRVISVDWKIADKTLFRGEIP